MTLSTSQHRKAQLLDMALDPGGRPVLCLQWRALAGDLDRVE